MKEKIILKSHIEKRKYLKVMSAFFVSQIE